MLKAKSSEKFLSPKILPNFDLLGALAALEIREYEK